MLGVGLSPAQSDAVIGYLLAIVEANKTINLTSISDLEHAIHLHAVDSLAVCPEVSSAPPGALLDLGAGAGFPGVPLALESGRPVVLLDSVKKKMAAVGAVLNDLALSQQIKVVGARAETHAIDSPGFYSVVVCRAVSPLACLVELAAPLLAVGGRLIAMKGAPCGEELAAGRTVAALVGLREVSVRRFTLPHGGESRTAVCYMRVGESQVHLPRRVGLAQHQPLA